MEEVEKREEVGSVTTAAVLVTHDVLGALHTGLK